MFLCWIEQVAAIFKIGNSKDMPEIPEHLSNHAKNFIKKCLNRDPLARPTAQMLLDHPFIRDQSATRAANVSITRDAFPCMFDGSRTPVWSLLFIYFLGCSILIKLICYNCFESLDDSRYYGIIDNIYIFKKKRYGIKVFLLVVFSHVSLSKFLCNFKHDTRCRPAPSGDCLIPGSNLNQVTLPACQHTPLPITGPGPPLLKKRKNKNVMILM